MRRTKGGAEASPTGLPAGVGTWVSQAKVCPKLFHLQSFDIDMIQKVFLQISKDSNRLVSDGKGGMKSDLKNTNDDLMYT